jgi:hypothetical protein
MQTHNWNTLGLLAIAIGIQIGALHAWSEAYSPAFIAGSLVALGAVLKGINQTGPGDKP